jgi:hypothetical protein
LAPETLQFSKCHEDLTGMSADNCDIPVLFFSVIEQYPTNLNPDLQGLARVTIGSDRHMSN